MNIVIPPRFLALKLLTRSDTLSTNPLTCLPCNSCLFHLIPSVVSNLILLLHHILPRPRDTLVDRAHCITETDLLIALTLYRKATKIGAQDMIRLHLWTTTKQTLLCQSHPSRFETDGLIVASIHHFREKR